MRVFVALIVAFLMVGCARDNEVKVVNIASGDIIFSFRAKEYIVGTGQEVKITDIPNGTFDYATTYTVPSSVEESEASDDASGLLSFEKSETHYSLVYSSSITPDGKTYNLNVTKTSTLFQTVTSP